MNFVIVLLFLIITLNECSTSKLPKTSTTESALPENLWSYCNYLNNYFEHYPSNIIDLKKLFDEQKSDSVIYQDFCGFDFLQLNKNPNSAFKNNRNTTTKTGGDKDVALLLGSIFTPTYYADNQTKINFDLPGNVAYHLPEEKDYDEGSEGFSSDAVTFRTVLRFDASFMTSNFSFSTPISLIFAGEHFVLKLNRSQREYLLPTTFRYNTKKMDISDDQLFKSNSSNQVVTRFPKEIAPYIRSSYYLVCTNVLFFEYACLIDVREDNHTVNCYCLHDRQGIIILIIFFTIAWPLLLIFSGYVSAASVMGQVGQKGNGSAGGYKSNQPENVQVNAVLCSSSEATDQYQVTFRIGPATDGFQASVSGSAKHWIDIQLLSSAFTGKKGEEGDTHTPIGSPLRFPLAKLNPTQSVLSELVMLVLKKGRMPQVTQIIMSHSSPGQLLLLYDFTVVDLMAVDPTGANNDGKVLQKVTLNCFITGEPTTVNVDAKEPRKLDAQVKNDINFDWMSVELKSLDSTEQLAFSIFAFGTISLLIMVVMVRLTFTNYHFTLNWLNLIESWPSVALLVLLSSQLGWLTLVFFQIVFTLTIKETYILERVQQQLLSESSSEVSRLKTLARPFSLLRLGFLLIFGILGLAAFFWAIVFSRQLDYALAASWSAVTMLVLVLLLGTWKLARDTFFAWLRSTRSQNTYCSVLLPDGRTWKAVKLVGDDGLPQIESEHSIFFPLNEPTTKRRETFVKESFGPKLFNPRFWAKKKEKSSTTILKNASSSIQQHQLSKKGKFWSSKQSSLYLSKLVSANNKNKSMFYSSKSKVISLNEATSRSATTVTAAKLKSKINVPSHKNNQLGSMEKMKKIRKQMSKSKKKL